MNTLLLSEKTKDYWLNEFKPPLSGWSLFTDYPKHLSVREIQRSTYVLDVSREQMNDIQRHFDLHIWMLTCYFVFLFRMSGEGDQIVGVSGNDGEVIPLRMIMDGNTSFRKMYRQVSVKLKMNRNSRLPLNEIEYITQYSPILETIYGVDNTYAHSCLNWHVNKADEQWTLDISYHKYLFKESTIRKFATHYQSIVQASLVDDDIAVASIPILTEEDEDAYDALNDTAKALPVNLDIPAMLRDTVRRFHDRIALSSGQQKLTYGRLDALSNQVAQMLRQRGLSKGGFVTIFMERSIEAVIAILGVLKAGGAYIPLDPEHPDARNAYIISDTDSYIVITKECYTPRLVTLLDGRDLDDVVFCLDTGGLDLYPEDPCSVSLTGDDVAYVLYTSGTTGKPKGVLIPHVGVINLAADTMNHLQLNEQDVILQYSTFSFGASVYDIFSSLCSGSRLHLLTSKERYSVEMFTLAVQYTRATRIGILPTVFFNQLSTYLSDEDARKYVRVKSFVIGGEVLTGEVVRAFQQKLHHSPIIVNAYGSTEASVVTTTHTIDYIVPEYTSSICIGEPITNYEVLIVNEHNQPCPKNVMGELLIHSVGLAKGYLNEPGLTEKGFVIDPVHPQSGRIYYRSGDLVQLQDHGIQYMGRKDLQVKIGGYRIEIGEIEDNLEKHEQIKDAVVIPKEDEDGNTMLVAFYTSKTGQVLTKSELVQFLKIKVPAYMVPNYFNVVESLPVSPTGKIDRKQLALIDVAYDDEQNSNYIAPKDDLQRKIAAAWESAFHRTDIGIQDDFFEIGGHSLKICEILVMLKPQFPRLKMNDFFQYPTIEKLAERVTVLAQTDPNEALDKDNGEIKDLAEFPRSFYNSDLLIPSKVYRQKHILLTGATGYLGSRLLYELLNRSDDTIVYCLIRSPLGEDPRRRLSDVMSNYFGQDILEKLDNQVIVIHGDLEKYGLGLTAANNEFLRQKVDSIIHCGGDVRRFGDSEYFTRVNVESTNSLLELIRDKQDARFHFVSTLRIPEELALSGQWNQFTDRDLYDYSVTLDNVCTNSKLEAEKLVVHTCEVGGVPTTVYRVGNLSCHSQSGVFQRNIDNNAFYRMLKAMILLKKAPRVNWQVDITPIDYAGESITSLVLHQATVGKMFHICNPVQISYVDLVESFRAYGYDIELVELREYESWLLDRSRPKDARGLELAMAQLEGDGANNSPYRYTCPQTMEYLGGSHVTCQEMNHEFFKRLIDYAMSIGYFDQP
ncbi:non-ribosomal peptide synthetase family protein [Paenibacillus segetis]|uniref:Peptide synthetase n=1 Tax=Paenibacillus segetis TaxID=1325360 RepID=A0ABQ1YX45_9BACL|nr:non-ribosomal peptide synthetase [Paenibacillus segetis]GGH39623.1 peptide synthetase [Paenibacillus segetis]